MALGYLVLGLGVGAETWSFLLCDKQTRSGQVNYLRVLFPCLLCLCGVLFLSLWFTNNNFLIAPPYFLPSLHCSFVASLCLSAHLPYFRLSLSSLLFLSLCVVYPTPLLISLRMRLCCFHSSFIQGPSRFIIDCDPKQI